jgi:hypothetical protein
MENDIEDVYLKYTNESSTTNAVALIEMGQKKNCTPRNLRNAH